MRKRLLNVADFCVLCTNQIVRNSRINRICDVELSFNQKVVHLVYRTCPRIFYRDNADFGVTPLNRVKNVAKPFAKDDFGVFINLLCCSVRVCTLNPLTSDLFYAVGVE